MMRRAREDCYTRLWANRLVKFLVAVLAPGAVTAAGVAYFAAGEASLYRSAMDSVLRGDAPAVAVALAFLGGLTLLFFGYPVIANSSTSAVIRFVLSVGGQLVAVAMVLIVIAVIVAAVLTGRRIQFLILLIIILSFLPGAIFGK